ncbi:MAG: pyruvate dehydrogenase complex dihydrolipoamide acetyltransferase [Verrucomicrobia bacterium]|nr:pyruvate dehydrogenase complex dihydrolipoamide acetyltransferase [Verrucomicrobiota bacterium]
MPFTLTMPKLSPTMEGGVITKWQKNEGEEVKAGDVLFEVATDKATVEYNSLDDGFLRVVLVGNGKEALVGAPVAILSSTKEEDITSYKPESKVQEKEKPAFADTPVFTEEKSAERVVSTATLSQPAFTPEPALENYEFPFPVGTVDKRIKATPYAKKIAKDKGIDLSTVKGSGPNQRIVSGDLSLGQKGSLYVFGKKEVPSIPPGTYEEEALSPMRKVIAQRLQQSKSFIPHFYVTQVIDAEPMMALREQLKAGDVKVTFNDIVVRALALALKEHPTLNSGFDSVTQSIIYFKTVDISVAVTVPEGLITPIIRHADYKNLGQIASEVKALAEKAKIGKLAREEYMGGSFTLSNLGMFGISEFKGIINPPQAGILCVGGIEDKAVVKSNQVVPGKVMTLSLSADHRVVDGADGAKFMKTLQKLLENPALLIL